MDRLIFILYPLPFVVAIIFSNFALNSYTEVITKRLLQKSNSGSRRL